MLGGIDKSNWRSTSLDDVVIRKEENDKEHAKERFDRFVKVEHMDAESLHLKRWGSHTEEELPPTFYKVFRKGQILFPTRNPHLRRTALAHFDGICGEKTLTLEPNLEIVDPTFLPFLFNSESFVAHTTSSIIGSTNPHVRWRDVAKYQFLIPPKDQQLQLAELLWAADLVVENEVKLLDKLSKAFDSEIENLIHGININSKTIKQVIEELTSHAKLDKLENLGTFLKGRGIPKSDVQHEGIPCIRYGELYTKHHRIVREYYSFISKEIAKESFRLKKNDVLFASSGETIEEIGKSAAFIEDCEAYAGSDTLIFRPDNMNGVYLGYLLNCGLVRHQLNKYGTGATVMHIYMSDLKKIVVPRIERVEQDRIAEKLEWFEVSRKNAENQIQLSKQLQKSLINQIF